MIVPTNPRTAHISNVAEKANSFIMGSFWGKKNTKHEKKMFMHVCIGYWHGKHTQMGLEMKRDCQKQGQVTDSLAY